MSLYATFDGYPEGEGEKKTPEEWDRELNPDTIIYDPDGWRGTYGRPWSDPITREEFEARRVTCTIIGRKEGW